MKKRLKFWWHRFWADYHGKAWLNVPNPNRQPVAEWETAKYHLKRAEYHAREQTNNHAFGRGWYNKW